jgi:hypothetical protein
MIRQGSEKSFQMRKTNAFHHLSDKLSYDLPEAAGVLVQYAFWKDNSAGINLIGILNWFGTQAQQPEEQGLDIYLFISNSDKNKKCFF